MNPPVPPSLDPHTTKAVNDVIEYGGKAAVSLGAIVGFFKLVAQPGMNWRAAAREKRKKEESEMIREVLKDELARLEGICDREEAILDEYQKIVARQEQIFGDLDFLIDIATDNRDRLDEMNCLLDEMGFSSRDRRSGSEQRQEELTLIMEGLIERRKARRRKLPIHPKEQQS